MRRHLNVSIQSCLLYFLVTLTFQAAAQHQNVPSKPQSDVILGVLEDHAGIYSGDPYFRVVRAVFQKQAGEWRPFPTSCRDVSCLKQLTNMYPQEVTWTIAFDGKNLGQVTARTPAEFRFYGDVGIEKITNSGPVPTVGKRSIRYTNWFGEPLYRPLVAVSRPNFKDPYAWKPTQPLLGQIDTPRALFRSKFTSVSNCKNPYENKPTPWKYLDEDIKIQSSYSSSNGWTLIELRLTGYACDGPTDDNGPFDSQWYVIAPSGKIQFLGSGMWLVDAGDYDGDGKSEALFAVAGYNLGGYSLFYRDFSRSAEFLFSYH